MTTFSAALMLFFILDPLGNLPVFNHQLADVPRVRRRAVILRECLIALAVLMIFLLAGKPFMQTLGLKEQTLTLGGGVVLFLIALKMVFPEHGIGTGAETPAEEPFIVPLAIPLFAGPSALAYVLLLASNHPERQGDWVLAIGAAWAAATIILLGSSRIESLLGSRTLRAIEKLAGMLLILLALQMILDGWQTPR